jgi:hypothetical protein
LFIEIIIFGATNFGKTQVNSWRIQTHPAPTVGSLIPPCWLPTTRKFCGSFPFGGLVEAPKKNYIASRI